MMSMSIIQVPQTLAPEPTLEDNWKPSLEPNSGSSLAKNIGGEEKKSSFELLYNLHKSENESLNSIVVEPPIPFPQQDSMDGLYRSGFQVFLGKKSVFLGEI